VLDRGSAGLLAQRGADSSPEREPAQHCRHQARNVEVNWIRFRCILQPRSTSGKTHSSCITNVYPV